MADVSGDDRGQLLLVAGLVIAITFVLLVLVLNTVIYTENLGTRSTDVGGDDAVAYERAAVDHVGALLPYYVEDPTIDAEAAFSEEMERWVVWSQVHSLAQTNYVDVTVTETRGTRILHTNDEREFTDVDGKESWTLAEGVERTPLFQIQDLPVDEEGGLLEEFLGSDDFRVVITDDGGDEWELVIHEDEDENEDPVVVAETDGGSCEIEDEETIVDLVAGSVDECDDIGSFTDEIEGPYSIRYENADNIQGTYELFLDVPRDEVEETDAYHEPTESPYTTSAVYYATIEVRYENTRLTYESTVDVSPEGGND